MMDITFNRVGEQTQAEVDALRSLGLAVFPPEVEANWPGRLIEWSPRQWCVVVWNDDHSRAIGHAGIVIRTGRLNDEELQIGGIGGVMTHPDHRNRGIATTVLSRCIEFFREQATIDVGLLTCEQAMMPFYARRGWRHFGGELLVTQRGDVERFTFDLPMTFPIRRGDEPTGRIDLLGPPW